MQPITELEAAFRQAMAALDAAEAAYYAVADSDGLGHGTADQAEAKLERLQARWNEASDRVEAAAEQYHRSATIMGRIEELEAVERSEADYEELFEGVYEDESLSQCPHCDGYFSYPADEEPRTCPGCGRPGPFAHITQ